MKDPQKFIEEAVAKIKEQVLEGKRAIIAASGGVDSTVAAVLCAKALGNRLTAIHVDTGLMRKDESKEVVETLNNAGVKVDLVEAQERFYTALKGIVDPEEKRKIIGKLFIDIFEEEANKLENFDYLVQGTIAPDWIESGQGKGGMTDVIKSHHNVGGLPEDMKLKLVEPVRDLYKDEVRQVGAALEVPRELYEKQPFPGPGLAVRIVGNVTEEKVKLLQEADAIVREEVEKAVGEGKIEQPWQYFAVFLPVQSVGVQGDARAYGETIGVRIVDSLDAMTANFTKVPQDVLVKISTRITNVLKDKVNRVVYDITNKPPSTIEWE